MLKPVKKAEDMTDDEAVRKLQHWVRVRRNRAKLRLYARAVWRKIIDEASGEAYYFNTQSKVSDTKGTLLSSSRTATQPTPHNGKI